MADDGANGSSVSVVGSSATPLRDISYSAEAAKVRVSGMGDATHTYEAGLPDESITLTVVGVTDVEIGDKGATTITWNDGSTSSITNSVVVSVSSSGSLDGEITSNITVVPSTAAGS